jgi:hypothetical protein
MPSRPLSLVVALRTPFLHQHPKHDAAQQRIALFLLRIAAALLCSPADKQGAAEQDTNATKHLRHIGMWIWAKH